MASSMATTASVVTSSMTATAPAAMATQVSAVASAATAPSMTPSRACFRIRHAECQQGDGQDGSDSTKDALVHGVVLSELDECAKTILHHDGNR